MANVVLTTEEEQPDHVPARTLPPSPTTATTEAVAPTPVASVVPPSRRYDQSTTEKALARAAELQHKYDSELTVEQVVSIGEEAHVRPEFVLQALALVEAEAAIPAATHAASPVKQNAARRHPAANRSMVRRSIEPQVPDRSKRIAAGMTASYTLFVALSLSGVLGFHLSRAFVFLVLGPLLAVSVGAATRSRRLGLVNGFFLGLGLFLAIVSVASPYTPHLSEMIVPLLVFCGTGAVLGATGAAIRRCIVGSPRARKHLAALLRHCSEKLDS